MSKLFWRAIKSAPAVIVGSLFVANATVAQTAPTGETNPVNNTLEQIDRYQGSSSQPSMSQVTNVNQLRDVQPTDWAYEALRSLVDRYGCIAGFPNQTYRGYQALSRYEFAAGLNSCLNQIERLIASSEAVVREDIDTINRLTQEFEAELATIGGRIDSLESRTAFLEDNQFSTTTKLNGEVIFALADTFNGDEIEDDFNDIFDDDDDDDDDDDNDGETQTTLSNRVRLNFDSSFYGDDRLRVRLESGNVPNFGDFTGSDSTRLGFDTDNGNDIEIDDLYYRFSVLDERFTAWVGANSLDLDDIFLVSNPMLESSGTGALSRFSRRNPITLRGVEGAGIGLSTTLAEKFTVTGLYLTDGGGSSPNDGEGVFNGSFSTGAQVGFTPNENTDLALTYVYEYQTEDSVDLTGSTASNLAKAPFGETATRAHQVGLNGSYQLGERIVFGAWGAGSFASEAGDDDGEAILYTAALNVSFLDLGKEGAVFSLAGGIPPQLVKNEGGEEDEDTSWLIEALYKYPLNDNILITPGAYVVLNPNGNSDNDTQIVGVIRTTFQF